MNSSGKIASGGETRRKLRPGNKELLEKKKLMSSHAMALEYGVSDSTMHVWLERAGYRKIINSKQKGKRGELEAAHEFQKYGIDARRTAQTRGKTNGSPDIEGVPGYWVEVKRNEHLSIQKAMEQAGNDSNGRAIPIVMHRKNRQDWMVTMMDGDELVTVPFKEWIKGLSMELEYAVGGPILHAVAVIAAVVISVIVFKCAK